MHLIMFDLDGTLIHSNTLDVHCFVHAMQDLEGIDRVDGDWTRFPYATDLGIVADVLKQALGRPAREGEIQAVRSRIYHLLRQEAPRHTEWLTPLPGSVEMIQALNNSQTFAVAIATGCWKEMAAFKLETAGFDTEGIPMATSDDSHRREEIMAAAFERVCARYQVTGFESITYVGDGTWDVEASRRMGYGFIGIGSAEGRALLQEKGARRLLPDYRDQAAFLAMVG
jgi:phosphoglycolate phosphatase-like HAD superfamily hydrolase